MKLKRVEIENYRAIETLDLPLDPDLTVFHGANGHGKTSVLRAIAMGLSSIPRLLPGVSAIGYNFPPTDRRGLQPLRVGLTTVDGIAWERQSGGERGRSSTRELQDAMEAIVEADREGAEPLDLPIFAFYDTDRTAFDDLQRDQIFEERRQRRDRDFEENFPRYAALGEALAPRGTNVRVFLKWFYARENEELREKNERRDWDYRLKELNAVRTAIERMISGITDPRIKPRPLRFVVSMESETDKSEELALDQLSGGYRIMLALAADLARRMAQGNPHLDDPLQSEAIVLIDEVDLHLHPDWQQRVLTDLATTFPNAQFIVSTHSSPVLTTVRPEQIVELRREDGRIVPRQFAAPTYATYGAEAGSVLKMVMGVQERPAAEHNEFVKKLEEYMRLVYDGRGRSKEAVSLRGELKSLSPRDPALDAAELEMERQEIFARSGKES